ncbi:hypothetical protein GIB67_038905 [Kingdonia uniflora]|uniref:Uncharacterized protein n=1 Tax=Kingdonia uniflora TaxID=39325 RepID=A0A7J7LQ70_9MAGN|nr:hypothetical protein GIB67_038905 [Kingdonia uniflora]
MEEGRNNLVFAINGVRFEVSKIDPSTTLLEFIRTQTRYKGTKPSCGEGSFAIVQNLFGLLFGSISKEATNVACSDNPSSDSREVEKASTDIGACPKTVNVQDLKQPMAFLLSVVAETGLGSYVLPSNFEEAVTGVLKVLNNLALLDITLLQGMLTMSEAKDLKDLKNAVMGSESNGDDTKDKFDPEKHIDAHLAV